MWFQAWILVALIVSQSLASPFRRHFMKPKILKIEIDCNDTKKVQRLEQLRVNYKCFEGTDKFLEIVVEPDVPRVTNVESVDRTLVNSIDDCKNSKRCREKLCEPDQVFVPSINKCVPKTSDWASLSLQNPDEILTTRNCKTGYSYHPGLDRCLPQNHFYFQSMNSASSRPSYTFVRCGYNRIFISEIGTCVPNTMMERLQMDVPASAPLVSDIRPRCATGYLYSSEIDMCLPFKRPYQYQLEGPTSLSLVQEESAKNVLEKLAAFVGKHKCAKNEFYLSEVDICIAKPQQQAVMQNDAPAVAITTDDSLRITISPGTPDQVGKSKCKKGQVYISEIDLCVDNLGK